MNAQNSEGYKYYLGYASLIKLDLFLFNSIMPWAKITKILYNTNKVNQLLLAMVSIIFLFKFPTVESLIFNQAKMMNNIFVYAYMHKDNTSKYRILPSTKRLNVLKLLKIALNPLMRPPGIDSPCRQNYFALLTG